LIYFLCIYLFVFNIYIFTYIYTYIYLFIDLFIHLYLYIYIYIPYLKWVNKQPSFHFIWVLKMAYLFTMFLYFPYFQIFSMFGFWKKTRVSWSKIPRRPYRSSSPPVAVTLRCSRAPTSVLEKSTRARTDLPATRCFFVVEMGEYHWHIFNRCSVIYIYIHIHISIVNR
jgi:hypothetical protein